MYPGFYRNALLASRICRVLWRRDGEGHGTRFEVDARGRVIAEQRPLQRSIATQYNVHDQPTRIRTLMP